ncbi:MAG: hypothetical protein R3F37_14185 [Candidatus Competibacteraceae bacterium]
MSLDDFFDECQADALTGIFLSFVPALEKQKYLLPKLRLNAYAVVAY